MRPRIPSHRGVHSNFDSIDPLDRNLHKHQHDFTNPGVLTVWKVRISENKKVKRDLQVRIREGTAEPENKEVKRDLQVRIGRAIGI